MHVADLLRSCPQPRWHPWRCWPPAQTKLLHLHLHRHPRPHQQRQRLLPPPRLKPQHPRPWPPHPLLQKHRHRRRLLPTPTCPWSTRKTRPLWLWALWPKPARPMSPSTPSTPPVRPAATAPCSAASRATQQALARCFWASRSARKVGAALTPKRRREQPERSPLHNNKASTRRLFFSRLLLDTSRGYARTSASSPIAH
jgi:hypothetical protein